MKKLAFLILCAGASLTSQAGTIKGKCCGIWTDDGGATIICCAGTNGTCARVIPYRHTVAGTISHVDTFVEGNPEIINSSFNLLNAEINDGAEDATISGKLVD